MKMWLSLMFTYGLIFLANSSKCPEPKKPYHASCTIFYNCVNLPAGGYVWVPSRCTDGLVFQPYLRTCVVPGDRWMCNPTPLTDSTLVTETLEPIDSTDTNYSGYTRDSFSETIDSSYVIYKTSTSTVEMVTHKPYSYNEFEKSYETMHGTKVRNVSYYKEENYLYEFIDNQQLIPLPLKQKYKNIVRDHYKWLGELINTLHDYKKLLVTDSSIFVKDTTVNPTETIAIFASHNHRKNVSLNYLVQNYVEGNKLQNEKPSEMEEENDGPQIENVVTTPASTLELLINGLDPDNNIIMINDNLGNRRYLTIYEYRTVAQRLTPQSIHVVACTKNVRLTNRTDCNKYYTCDPKTASVIEYSCPFHTAFNVHSRVCDVESTKTCGNKYLPPTEIFVERIEYENTSPKGNPLQSQVELCQELGKVKDPASDFHYHICYSNPGSDEIKSIRMTCPNVLIFCQSKKVCTTRRLCDVSR